MKFFCGVTVVVMALILFVPTTVQANLVTVSLSVSSSSVISDHWSTGSLVEVIIQAASDGGSGQGFSGADFGSGSFAITVDGSKLKIHDVSFYGTQVDTESSANSFNGIGVYLKANDTWVYDNFTDFVKPAPPDTRNIIITDTSMRVIPSAILGQYDLGRSSPVNFIHVVLEVQAGLTPDSSSPVTFYGQVGAFGTAQEDIRSNLFGTAGTDVNTGSFSVTNLPEPASLVLLLIGSVLLPARRKFRNKS